MSYIQYHLESILNHMEFLKQYFQNISDQRPPGSLQIRRYKGNPLYVHSQPALDTGKSNTRRTLRDNDPILYQLASGQYASTALKIIENNISTIKLMQKNMIEITPEHVSKQLSAIYRSLPDRYFMKALSMDETDFLDHYMIEDLDGNIRKKYMPGPDKVRWANEDYEISDFRQWERDKETSFGLKVRSKSELVFCEKLYEYNIPFRYEQIIHIGTYRLAPDFTLLDRNNREFYVEYWGKMTDPDYVDRFFWKRKLYEGAGICEWDNMINVFEKHNVISVKKIETIIQNQIMPKL